MKCRQGETEVHKVRSKRFYCVNDEWYFSTREKLQVGPFPSRESAEDALRLFLHNQEHKISPATT